MSRLSVLAVSKRSVTLLLAAALFVSGIVAWGNLKQELLPDIQLPLITVIASEPGAGAADVADQVAKPIERVISGVPRLEQLQSVSANSIGLVIAQFSYGTDIKETRATIEQGLQGASLPSGVTPQVSTLDINASPVIIASVAAKSESGLDAAAALARDQIEPALLGLDGVGSVDVTGGSQQRLDVTLDPAKLASNGITIAQVSGVLSASNLTVPSGELNAGSTRIPVSTVGSLDSVAAVRDLVVGYTAALPTASGQAPAQPRPITIGDLGTVELANVSTTGYARTNGQPAVSISVSKTSTANTVQVADEVTAKLGELQQQYGNQVTITVVSDLSQFIKESRDGLLREGGTGALFAILTIFLFLFSIRSTLVAAVSIPLSLLAALVIMAGTGITLNVLTLGGLAVAVGRVVDDAIVVLENIYRHRALGEPKLAAVLAGPREVAGAITAATVTTVGVFLPLGFVGGLVSQFFLPFALTVTFALLASLVCALTVVPVLAYLLIDRVRLNVDPDGEPRNSLWLRIYTPVIRLVLRNRWTKLGVLAVAIALFIGTAAIAPLLPTSFINAGSEKAVQVTIAPPAGASASAVLDRTKQAEQILMNDPSVQLVQASIPSEGEAGFQSMAAAFSGIAANSARLTVRLVDTADVDTASQALADALAPVKAGGYQVAVSEAAGFTSNNLQVIVSGDDPAAVATANDAVVAALADNPNLRNLKSDLSKGTPEIEVTPDPAKAITVGLTSAQVAQQVRAALVGSTATRIVLTESGSAVDVFVQLDPSAVSSLQELRDLPVGSVAKVPLSRIASVEQVDTQGSITRIDQAPAASITAEITANDTGAVSGDVQGQIDRLQAQGSIPPGVDVRLAGVTQQQNEAFSGLFFSMGVAILVVYLAMVLTFNSLITPFIILFSLSLATIGAFVALYLTGRPLSVSALIGFLMLIGIVVTNAIVLLDLVERHRAEGMSTTEALIEGGRTRVRPILMTAIATILALIPLAAGFNQGSIIAAELGTVVIGGLFTSTFLTLVVVPVVYSLVDGIRSWRPRGTAGEAA
jgi:hydrophobic/amphiphilic exporter-1 (mainly G- bacteria), HAE1 family